MHSFPALLLAAGRGQRMRPLSDHTPKPLLCVQGSALLGWHLQALARANVARVVVNTAWLGEQIAHYVKGNTAVLCSHEGRDFGYALETAGGIARALPLLDSEVFWLAAGDVFAPDFPFAATKAQQFASGNALAHLWLVPNPPQHPLGDFALSPDGLVLNGPTDAASQRYTYSTIALLRAALFAPPYCALARGNPQGVVAPLAPLLRAAIEAGRVTGEMYTGLWVDVGTPERLAALNR